MKNKFILGLLAFALIALVSCGDDEEPAAPEEETGIVGTWTLEPVVASLAVGPSAGSADYWFIPAADVTTRACLYNDTYKFNADGTFELTMGTDTWLETWQGVAVEGCGAPVAPHAGGSFTYTFNEVAQTLSVSGNGAHVGLAKVNNAGELPNVAVPTSITYNIAEFSGVGADRKMKLIIEAGSGVFWTYLLQAN